MSSTKRIKTDHSFDIDQVGRPIEHAPVNQSINQSVKVDNSLSHPPANHSRQSNAPFQSFDQPDSAPGLPAIRIRPVCHREMIDEICLIAPVKQASSTARIPMGHIKLINDGDSIFSIVGEFHSFLNDANHASELPLLPTMLPNNSVFPKPKPEYHEFSFTISNLHLSSSYDNERESYINLSITHNGTTYSNPELPVPSSVQERNFRVAISPSQEDDESNFDHIVLQFVNDSDVELCYLRIEPSTWYDVNTLTGHWSQTGTLPQSASALSICDPVDAARVHTIEHSFQEDDDESEHEGISQSLFAPRDARDDALEEDRAALFIAVTKTRHSNALHDFLKAKQTDHDWLLTFEDPEYEHNLHQRNVAKNRSDSKHWDGDYITEFALLQWKLELMIYSHERDYITCVLCETARRLPSFVNLDAFLQFSPFVCPMNPDTNRQHCDDTEMDPTTHMTEIWEADDCCGMCELPAKGRLPGNISYHRDREADDIAAYRRRLEVLSKDTAGANMEIHTYHTSNTCTSGVTSRCLLSNDPNGEPDPLVACAGPCLRSFHMSCSVWHSKTRTEGDTTDWYCSDCRRGYQHCFVCGVKGKVESVVRRCEAVCGHFFHPQCLPPATRWHPRVGKYIFHVERRFWQWLDACGDNGDVAPNSAGTQSDKKKNALFICPAHWCNHCGFSGEGRLLMRCLKCPIAYHGSNECRPRNIHQVTEWSFICHSHDSSGKTKRRHDNREKMIMKQAKPDKLIVQAGWLERAQETERRIGLRSLPGEMCTAPLSSRNKPLFQPVFEYRYPLMPMRLTARTILSLGSIVIDRKAFHNTLYIFPVGFKSLYNIEIEDYGVRTLLCSVVDDGDRPMFRIDLLPSSSDDDEMFFLQHSSVRGAWTNMLDNLPVWLSGPDDVKANKKAWEHRMLSFNRSQKAATHVFGFSDNEVANLIRQMPMFRFVAFAKDGRRRRGGRSKEVEDVDDSPSSPWSPRSPSPDHHESNMSPSESSTQQSSSGSQAPINQQLRNAHTFKASTSQSVDPPMPQSNSQSIDQSSHSAITVSDPDPSTRVNLTLANSNDAMILSRDQQLAYDEANMIWKQCLETIERRHIGHVTHLAPTARDVRRDGKGQGFNVEKLLISFNHPCPFMPIIQVTRDVSLSCFVSWLVLVPTPELNQSINQSGSQSINQAITERSIPLMRTRTLVQYVRAQSLLIFPRSWNQAPAFGSPPDQLINIVEKCKHDATNHLYVQEWMAERELTLQPF